MYRDDNYLFKIHLGCKKSSRVDISATRVVSKVFLSFCSTEFQNCMLTFPQATEGL